MSNPIRLVITDLDGTLLNSRGEVSAANETAVRQVIAKGVPVVIATGKTRYSAAKIIGRLGLQTPGVFIQGLVVCEPDGGVRHQQHLAMDIVETAVAFCQEQDISLFAYCHDRLLTLTDSDHRHELHERYHEPLAEVLSTLPSWAEAGINKLLMHCHGPAFPAELRQQLAALIGERAALVQALPTSLEILPLGTSKGAGVAWLLADLAIDPQQVMAMGDAENDIEMLQLVGMGVAMGNAVPRLKAVADYVVSSNDEDGVAEAITRFVL
jgi:Cof subfamily protein (haloacid dehalogenase superfamily)